MIFAVLKSFCQKISAYEFVRPQPRDRFPPPPPPALGRDKTGQKNFMNVHFRTKSAKRDAQIHQCLCASAHGRENFYCLQLPPPPPYFTALFTSHSTVACEQFFQPTAKVAAHVQARAVLENHRVIAIKHRLQFLDGVHIHNRERLMRMNRSDGSCVSIPPMVSRS